MAAGIYDIIIEQGADWRLVITWKDAEGVPVNLTGYTARMHMREKVEYATPFMSFTTSDSSIVLGGAAGTIQIKASAAVTSTVTAKEGVYDLELVAPSGDVVRFLEGLVIVSEEVTR